VSVIPSGVRVAETLNRRSLSRSGLADLPVAVAASYTFPAAWSPDVGAGLTVTLPTGSASCGLGSGLTSVGVNAGVGVAPIDPVHLSVDASRSLTGGIAQSVLTAPHATWVGSAASLALSNRWTATLSVGADLGHGDSTRLLGREVGGGVSYALAGPLVLTLDASHGVTAAPPKWVLSIGLGTAFAGTSPVIPMAPLRRLRTTFVGGKPKTTTVTASGCP
jgi:hypothetical protein